MLSAFCLGACPFSVWVGRWLLNKDIRDYGDGNPGATNVLHAGGRKPFYLAAILDIAKGIPFVLLAHIVLKLHDPAVYAIVLFGGGEASSVGHEGHGFLDGKHLVVVPPQPPYRSGS